MLPRHHLSVLTYQGSIEEKSGLAELCQEWTVQEFWPFEEFLLSLRIPGSFLQYQVNGKQWVSMALGRAGGDCVELYYIYVSIKARRQGLATQILAEFCRTAKRDWVAERVSLEVRPSNIEAKNLYEQHGFYRLAVRKRYYQNGDDAWVYEKNLLAVEEI